MHKQFRVVVRHTAWDVLRTCYEVDVRAVDEESAKYRAENHVRDVLNFREIAEGELFIMSVSEVLTAEL